MKSVETVDFLVRAGIPVMGHIGFTPQATNQLGGFGVASQGEEAAASTVKLAQALEQAGAFATVIERVPREVGRRVAQAVSIPVIGAGAGPDTDAQVLLLQWMLGLTSDQLPLWFRKPRWAKQYRNVRGEIIETLDKFRSEVASGVFPDADYTYGPDASR